MPTDPSTHKRLAVVSHYALFLVDDGDAITEDLRLPVEAKCVDLLEVLSKHPAPQDERQLEEVPA